MQKKINNKVIYRFEEAGFSINIYESKGRIYTGVKYGKDLSIYLCSNIFEAKLLMFSLLSEYKEKKRIVEEIIGRI